MIYLVRHGEAAAGWGDHPNPGLSEVGHAQARVAARLLLEHGVKSVVSSPMQRCRETASAFESVASVTAMIAPEVSEIQAPAGVEDRVSWLRAYMAGQWLSEGKDYLPWRQSMMDFLATLPDHTVVFSHFVAINAVVSYVENDPRTTVFKPGYCSVTVLGRSEDGWYVAQKGSEAATRVL